MRSAMMYRYSEARVLDNTAPLYCTECLRLMDDLGGVTSDLCYKGLGWNTHRYAVYRLHGKKLVSAAGFAEQSEVPHLLAGLNVRTADVLVIRRHDSSITPLPFPVAYDVTIVSPFQKTTMRMGAKAVRAVFQAGQERKMSELARKAAAVPSEGPPWMLATRLDIRAPRVRFVGNTTRGDIKGCR
eukprot:GFKZ01012142.1.p1 GENE.GFKZ01012142.1~~GFKZ01012142.1.p1  ORF type:complete len:185 (-),score=6.02 GFKZ01012142.1:888-1442(-)